MDRVDVVIAGGGVIGLAVAYELAQRWPERSILLLEQADSFGLGLSSRTSEVLHSGAYYPAGSLKAGLCVSGNRMLYQFCEQHQVPFSRLGKVIIARNAAEEEQLALLFEQAIANGVPEIELLTAGRIAALEPNIRAGAGLLCPTSGIVDSHRLMAKLAYGAKAHGAMLVYRQEITGVHFTGREYCLEFTDDAGIQDSLYCRCIVNAAGLTADRIAALAGIDIDQTGYRIYRCKGEYFAVSNHQAQLITRLVFPVSIRELKGSGIPVIKDLKGRLRLGPDAHYAPASGLDYSVQPANAGQFLQLVREYLPFLQAGDLQPDLAGIRPRLQVPCGSPPRDFLVCHEEERGLPGMVNLLGIESPGLTCCLSLAGQVGDLLTPVVR